MYSPQLLDHFQNPRNPGEVAGADATAEIENPACGDVVRLTVRVRDGCIAEIRFKAKGCVAAIACASALTDLVAGRTIEQARHMNRDAIIAALDGLPQASTHAAQLAIDTLAQILSQVGA